MTDKEAIGVLGYQLNMRNTDVYTPINYEAIETVLNLIQTQQKEIERLKQTELNAKGGAVKITLEGLLELKVEIEKKNKIIDEMAKELVKTNYMKYCNVSNCDYPPCNKEKCIKEYFIHKVEKD